MQVYPYGGTLHSRRKTNRDSVPPPFHLLAENTFLQGVMRAAKAMALRLVLLQLLSAPSFHLLANLRRLMHPRKISKIVSDISLEASDIVWSLFSRSRCRRALRASIVERLDLDQITAL